MQIKAFNVILVQQINITGHEDYENTFAWMECDCTLKFGFKALMKGISYTVKIVFVFLKHFEML